MSKSFTTIDAVRQVWASNFDYEISLIYHCLSYFNYRVAALDTEFPGTVFTSDMPTPYYTTPPEEYYKIMKKNADALKLIQLGLTLNDMQGNMHTWQFNFCDFHPAVDLHNRDSIAMLRNQGIDFNVNKLYGVAMCKFAFGFRPILNSLRQKQVMWATFQGSYDFAFLMKNIRGQYLPDDVDSFMELMAEDFGLGTFDFKLITRSLGIHGGLEKVATKLGVQREIGSRHHAGSDSLLVMKVHMKIYDNYKQVRDSTEYSHKLYGLTLSHTGMLYAPSSSSSMMYQPPSSSSSRT